MSIYIHLFHGRDTPDEILDDWGYDGPTIGPVQYVHITYCTDLKYHERGEDKYIRAHNDLWCYEDKYYGDVSINISP